MSSLSIHTIGQLKILVGSRTAEGFDSDKVRALLLFLAVESDKPHRREALAGFLWPDFPDTSARTNLRRALANLRKVIGDQDQSTPFLNITRQDIQFNQSSNTWLDLWQFHELIEQTGSVETIYSQQREAVDLYRGPFLEGFTVRDSAAFEEWALGWRQHIERQVLDILAKLTGISEGFGDYEQALSFAQMHLKLDTWNDKVCREVMDLFFILGQPSQALITYEGFRQSLLDNIGTEPAAETTDLYAKIRSGAYTLESEKAPAQPIRGYEMRERIGSGHYGQVYRAYQPQIGRDVAIKVVRPQFANQPEFIRRFHAEAQLVARLEHPYIVPLYDYWREPDSAYLVMRWLRGGSLKDDLAKGPWNLGAAARLIDQISAALAIAHQQDVVHRDVKPANILLDERGDAYLSDFGIATMIGPMSSLSGQPAKDLRLDSVGSLGYISPEVAQGSEPAVSADIYGLGIVLYELLVGQHPFPGFSGQALVDKHLHDPIPLIADSSPGLPQAIDDVIQRATAKDPDLRFPDVLSLAAALTKALPSAADLVQRDTTAVADIVNPYKGLQPFQEADSKDFFGRQELLDHLVTRLSPVSESMKDSTKTIEGRFLVVLGPSGSGKSSVVNAGLLPALRRGTIQGSELWYIVTMMPGSQPLEELESALLRIAVNPPSSLREQLQRDERGLLRAVKRILPDPDSRLVLVIDQFEELFTLSEGDEERSFIIQSLFTALTDPGSSLIVILTLRADYYDKPLQYSGFGDLVRSQTEVILPLSPQEIQQVIERPANRLGIELEEGLVAAIIADVADQPGVLPMLQFVLRELFEQRNGSIIPLAAYHELGGVSGAVSRRAELLYKDFNDSEKEISRQLFLRLVALQEGSRYVKRRVLLSECQALTAHRSESIPDSAEQEPTAVPHPVTPVLEAYGRHRLLTFDNDPITRDPTVELAHEALIWEWSRLGRWLDESRSDIRLQRLLASAAGEWEQSGEDPSYLLRGSRLAQFEEWSTASTLVLTQLEMDYLSASIKSRERRTSEEDIRRQRELHTLKKLAETEKARADEQAHAAGRLRRRAVLLAGLLGLALIFAAAAALFAQQSNKNARLAAAQEALALAAADQKATAEHEALDQKTVAEAQTRLARSRELAAAALANLEFDPERSILLALEAAESTYRTDGFVIPEAEQALHRALQSSRIRFPISPGSGANFSPDGVMLASGGPDGKLYLWDAQTGTVVGEEQVHQGEVSHALFSPDGSLLATLGSDNTAKIWETENWKLKATLEGHQDALISPAWSPDGAMLVTTSHDGTARLWDVNSGNLMHTLVHSGTTAGPDFSPDGSLVAVADVDAEVARVWDVNSGRQVMVIDGHSDDVEEVAFSPDGSKLATASADGTARIWNLESGEEIARLEGHSGWVFSIRFSPDGSLIATGSEDGTAKIWDVSSGSELLTLAGHTSGIGKVFFSPNGSKLVTNSYDGTARVWDISRTGSRDWLTLDGHTDLVFNVDLSHDGSRLATASWDGTAAVWDLASGEELFELSGHRGEVSRLLFSPSNEKLASSSYDGTVKIWDAISGKELLTFPVSDVDPTVDEPPYVFGLAFNPDGTKLVTTSLDGSVKVWDLETGSLLMNIDGHDGPVFRPAYSPDGAILATAGWDGTVRLWDAETGESLALYETPEANNSVDFHPDGSSLAAAGWDATGRVWDLDSNELLYTLEGHQGIIWDIAYSADGSTLATGGFDTNIRLWDAADGRQILSLEVPGGGVADLTFSPDDRFLIAGGETARIFLLPVEELMDLARQRTTRSLTESECQQYLHLDRCPTAP